MRDGIKKCIEHLEPENETSLISQLTSAIGMLKYADLTASIDWSELTEDLNEFGIVLSAEEAENFFTAKRFFLAKRNSLLSVVLPEVQLNKPTCTHGWTLV